MIYLSMILCGKGMASHRDVFDMGNNTFTT